MHLRTSLTVDTDAIARARSRSLPIETRTSFRSTRPPSRPATSILSFQLPASGLDGVHHDAPYLGAAGLNCNLQDRAFLRGVKMQRVLLHEVKRELCDLDRSARAVRTAR